MDYSKKRIVITGASSGIGLELAIQLSHFASVAIVAVARNIEGLERLALPGVTALAYDLAKEQNVHDMLAEAIGILGAIDVFFANAGFTYYEQLTKPDYLHIEEIYRTNVFSPILALQWLLYLNGKRQCMFVVTSSAIVDVPMPGFSLYGSTKSAITTFADAIRHELPPHMGMCVVYPVATATDFFRRAGKDVPIPFPLQETQLVAHRILKGVARQKKRIYPSALHVLFKLLWRIFPFIKTLYINGEKKKYKKWLAAQIKKKPRSLPEESIWYNKR